LSGGGGGLLCHGGGGGLLVHGSGGATDHLGRGDGRHGGHPRCSRGGGYHLLLLLPRIGVPPVVLVCAGVGVQRLEVKGGEGTRAS